MGNSPVTQPVPTPAPASATPDVFASAFDASQAGHPVSTDAKGSDPFANAFSDSIAGRPASTTVTPTLEPLTRGQVTEAALGNLGAGVGEAAGDIWGAVKGIGALGTVPGAVAAVKGIWHQLPPVELADSVKQTLPLIDTYEKARASGASIGDAIKAADATARQHQANLSALPAVVKAFRENPTRESARALTDATALVASTFAGGGEVAAPEEEATAVAAKTPAVDTAVAGQTVNPVKRFIQKVTASPAETGEAVAQPAAQQTIRRAVQTATENAGTADASVAANIENQPLLGRNQTILDEHLSSLRGLEQDSYERMDEAAGFDVKAEKSQLQNDQYKLKQLGNTDADITQKEKLTASINDSQARIADAESKMKEAGIDPGEADLLHKQRMAGADLRKALIQNASSDGQTVNVNGLLNASKKLQFSKYGNRLQQFFGSPEAADNFLSGLEQAQKTGQTAMDSRALRNTILKVAGFGTVALGGVDVVKHLVE